MYPDPFYCWLMWFDVHYWKNWRGRDKPAYRPQHHISLQPQTARRIMRSVNRNR